jgi:hypothetical protein
MRIRLERVHYMPKRLEPGVLYMSEEFGTAAHLCACGCGAKIRTPLGPTEWNIEETSAGPTLRPSVGNWQQACQSHYWIWEGEIRWADRWTPEQILAGRRREEQVRKAYYDALNTQRSVKGQSLWSRLKGWFTQK